MSKEGHLLKKEHLLLLAKNPIFQGIEEDRLETLLSPRVQLRSFKRGEIIFSPRHFEESIGIFLSGTAVAEKGQGTVLLNTFQPGGCFGVATLFCRSRQYVTTVRAKKDCVVAFLCAEAMEELFREENRIVLNYISFLASRIHLLNRKIDKFTAASTEEKLIMWLLEQLEGGNPVKLSVSYVKLAEMLDMGRASLYRALDMLETQGVIRREGRLLTVLDTDRLEEYTGEHPEVQGAQPH